MIAGFAWGAPTRYHGVMLSTVPRVFVLLAAALAMAGAAGCAAPKKVWQKPGMTQEQWAIDSANCRSRAQDLAERDYAASPESLPGGADNADAYNAMMRTHNAKRGMEGFYRRCMETKGYRLVAPPPETKA